jgi:RNA polymerase sigma-70 factor (ECF subfamily)
MDERPDPVLVADVARGDGAALRALYLRYERPTFNLILRLAGDRGMAEELMQETFARVWTMAGTYRPERGDVRGWLFTIALNATRSELTRLRYRFRHVEEDAAESLPSRLPTPDVAAERSEAARDVQEALGRLPDLLREVVVLRIYQQLRFPEIAALTGTPEGTLRARFHRAAAQLREHLSARRAGP